MRDAGRRWQRGLVALALGGAILAGGCADTMMQDGDKAMMKEKGGMMEKKGMMEEKKGMMEEKKGMMEEKKKY